MEHIRIIIFWKRNLVLLNNGVVQMNIKVYIVTYKNENDLNSNIESIYKSTIPNSIKLQINVINNYSKTFYLNKSFSEVNVIHNDLRPDWSTGHLSRNWNQAIINGFGNLKQPQCDILVHCQDDTLFERDWISKLLELHKKYTFIQMGIGDNFCSYTIEAVKHIGLWDERFCGINYQEADYFLRAYLHNRNKSCINDNHHKRIWNPTDLVLCKRTKPIIINGTTVLSEENIRCSKFGSLNKNLFYRKWGVDPEAWTNESLKNVPTASYIENFIYYPYFELDLYDLDKKNYHCDISGPSFFEK